jgi:prephenate dehydratase
MRVGYLGPEGTVSHEALLTAPDSAAFELAPQPTLHEAVLAVHDGAVDRALVPIENSLEGSVNPTLDAIAFETDDVVIVGELRHPVHLHLVAAGPPDLDRVGGTVVAGLRLQDGAAAGVRERGGSRLRQGRALERRLVLGAVGGRNRDPCRDRGERDDEDDDRYELA